MSRSINGASRHVFVSGVVRAVEDPAHGIRIVDVPAIGAAEGA